MKNVVKEAADKARQKQIAFVRKERAKGKSYSQIGALMGLTRQRAQQLGKAAEKQA